jgi:hypothetical protein
MTVYIRIIRTTRWIEFSASILNKINRRITRAVDRIASLPAQIIWRLSKVSVIENSLLYPRYQKALEFHKNQLSILDKTDAAIVAELEQTGLHITSLEALGLSNTAEFFEQAQHLTSELKHQASLLKYDSHEVHALKAQLIRHSAISCWGLNERLLKIVEQYLGLPVAYDGASCFLSISNGKEIGARAWHRDREDRRMLKVCVYLSEVNEGSGPLQCLAPDLNSRLCDSIKHRYKSISNEEMEQFYSESASKERVSLLGQAGTVIFIDTARFYHRGKPPTQETRSAIFFSYFSRRPWYPFFCQRTPLSQKEACFLTQNLSVEQRACVNWHKDLPTSVRWIPKSRI